MVGSFWGVVALLLLASPTSVAATEALDVSAEEFGLYMDWMAGREDPRLEKYNDAQKRKKIARSLGVQVKVLGAAITKVGPVAGTLPQQTSSAIRAGLETTTLKGRILDVIIDAEQAHVVAGVQWRCGDPRDFDKEACWAAHAVGQTGRIVKTVGLWCTDSTGIKQFSAKIARSAAQRISKSSIERFAGSRYIRLFEEVKRGPHK